ncbi:MAG: hypothetical protein QG635_773, partial [Bacteroidota bacterium]|nr:hypothetical protein [Bacteroidota bacterium]
MKGLRLLPLILIALFATSECYSQGTINTWFNNGTYNAGTSATVSFSSSSATFNNGNVFTVQLSDTSGNFGTPVDIGSLSSTVTLGSIAVIFPEDALYGTGYKVRVVSSDPIIIGSAYFEPFKIRPIITITSVSSLSICRGNQIKIVYSVSSSFGSGNTFTAQLSNSSGGFPASPTVIGTLNSQNSGTITAAITDNQTTGTAYRIRIKASNPYNQTSADNGSNITIKTKFSDISAGLTGVTEGAICWGDYDNDDDLDLLVCGLDIFSDDYTSLYRNDGNDNFTEMTGINLFNVSIGDIKWIDYNNDGYLDISLLGWQNNSNDTLIIYRNNGNGGFTAINAGIIGLEYASMDWADVDNDGLSDLIITGQNDVNNDIYTKIFNNNGDDSFSEFNLNIIGLVYSSVQFADFDNDGDNDFIIGGEDENNNKLTKIYRNDGDIFTALNLNIAGISDGSVEWCDYNNDGKLDIIVCGGGVYVQPYLNSGNNSFTLNNTILEAIDYGSAHFGDFNNDGKSDVLISGSVNTGIISKIYYHNGSSFTNLNASLTGIDLGKSYWSDYNNDGYLDISIFGDDNYTPIAKIYKSNECWNSQNTAPAAPASLSYQVNNDRVTLSWNAASDNETPAAALSYNIYLGTSSGSGDIVEPMSNISNGYRKIVRLGNVSQNRSWSIKNLTCGTYYWSVQAIDNGYRGGAFASENTFTITNIIKTGDIDGSEFCAGAEIQVPFTDCGFNSGNVFTAQLSDASGSFGSPVNIGSLTSSAASGTITAYLPKTSSGGSHYRIRVVGSNPSYTNGSDNGANIIINALPSNAITGNTSVCEYSVVSYSTSAFSQTSYNWTVQGGSISGSSTFSSIDVNWDPVGSGTITLLKTNLTTGCKDTATSDIVINSLPVPTITGSSVVCALSQLSYSTTSSTEFSNIWSVIGGSIVGSSSGYQVEILWGSNSSGTLTLNQTNVLTGCSSSTYSIISIDALPSGNIIGSTSVCAENNNSYSTNSSANFQNQWLVSGGTIIGASTSYQLEISWGMGSTGALTLIQTDINTNCSKTVSQNIIINPLPLPSITGMTEVCADNIYKYNKTIPAGGSNTWTVSGGTINGNADGETLAVQWGNSSAGKVKLIQTTSQGCSDSIEIDIQIDALPLPSITGMTEVCAHNIYNYTAA